MFNLELEINKYGYDFDLLVLGYLSYLEYQDKNKYFYVFVVLEFYVVNQGIVWMYFYDNVRCFLEYISVEQENLLFLNEGIQV